MEFLVELAYRCNDGRYARGSNQATGCHRDSDYYAYAFANSYCANEYAHEDPDKDSYAYQDCDTNENARYLSHTLTNADKNTDAYADTIIEKAAEQSAAFLVKSFHTLRDLPGTDIRRADNASCRCHNHVHPPRRW